jgi:hypothetical protein
MPSKSNLLAKSLVLIMIIALTVGPLAMGSTSTQTSSSQISTVQLTSTTEYTNYVHTYINTTLGNYTYVEKPLFPVLIKNNQIPIGENWTIICPLQQGHSYHIYCYGQWIDTSSQAKTDYNIYVYDPNGTLESSHLESAGLPPHLGTNLNDAFFTPSQSGNYSFVISNSPFGSESAQEATFMIIENLQCNQWYSTFIQGTNSQDLAQFYTCWAYEFATNASSIEVCVKVPATLAVYETRLYLMSNGTASTLNSYPLPWEPGLYGNLSGSVGGYNFESDGYRGVAYASDEQMGQTMFLRYTAPKGGNTNLYHLVFIGDEGQGNVTFIIKTTFANETLTPITVPTRVYPNTPANITYALKNNSIDSAQLSYTVDNWTYSNTINMAINNQTCSAMIPGQSAGSLVQYRIQALDTQANNVAASGNYTVKEPLKINITAAKDVVRFGQNITINGVITPALSNFTVSVQFAGGGINNTKTVKCKVSSGGTFVATFKPDTSGLWVVTASSPATQNTYSGYSQGLTVTVTPLPLYVRYSLYILIGFVALMAVCVVIYILRGRQG